ncbi:hypothetical protein ACEQPO_10820 [Bacillus sp. SL00103]
MYINELRLFLANRRANSESRLQAYQDMMQSLGQAIDEEWIIEGSYHLMENDCLQNGRK